MKKRSISPAEEASLRSDLQAATLAALMDSRRWEPGDIAFQGGTSLHLVHGSARFSEDLDFMIRGGLSIPGLTKELTRRLRRPLAAASDLEISVTAVKSDRNPNSFYVTLSGPRVLGSVKVKVELWKTQDTALKSIKLVVSTVTSQASRAYVPTLVLAEIFADKVYALGARDRIKPRDVFDLWWLVEKGEPGCTEHDLLARLDIYPAPSANPADTAARWLESAALRLAELRSPDMGAKVSKDLGRWLPTSWPMSEDAGNQMLATAIAHLQRGIDMMARFHARPPGPGGAVAGSGGGAA